MNKNEIERKFLVASMPDITGMRPISYERYYISRSPILEERIQKKDDTYEYERKEKVSSLERTKEKKVLTPEEFQLLRGRASEAILRDSYLIKTNPEISIKVYHGKHEGLVRVEVEFESVAEAVAFQPHPWMGKEITNTPLGRDADLLDLSDDEFQSLLKDFKTNG